MVGGVGKTHTNKQICGKLSHRDFSFRKARHLKNGGFSHLPFLFLNRENPAFPLTPGKELKSGEQKFTRSHSELEPTVWDEFSQSKDFRNDCQKGFS
jgi:hypothetical protein